MYIINTTINNNSYILISSIYINIYSLILIIRFGSWDETAFGQTSPAKFC